MLENRVQQEDTLIQKVKSDTYVHLPEPKQLQKLYQKTLLRKNSLKR